MSDQLVPVTHGSLIEEDDEGWWHAGCDCGFSAGPVPDFEDAADVYGDHMFNAGFLAARRQTDE